MHKSYVFVDVTLCVSHNRMILDDVISDDCTMPDEMFKYAQETIGREGEVSARRMRVLAEQGVWRTARSAPIALKIARPGE